MSILGTRTYKNHPRPGTAAISARTKSIGTPATASPFGIQPGESVLAVRGEQKTTDLLIRTGLMASLPVIGPVGMPDGLVGCGPGGGVKQRVMAGQRNQGHRMASGAERGDEPGLIGGAAFGPGFGGVQERDVRGRSARAEAGGSGRGRGTEAAGRALTARRRYNA